MKHTMLCLALAALAINASAQTILNHDLNPGSGQDRSSAPAAYTPFNNQLYFTAWLKDTGYELWSLDTAVKPVLTQNIQPGPDNGVVRPKANFPGMTVVKDAEGKELALYFFGYNNPNVPGQPKNHTLFKYDLTATPTPVIPALGTGEVMAADEIVAVGTNVYFLVSSPTDGTYVYEYDHKTGVHGAIFKNNITAAGNLTAFNGKLVFAEKDGMYEFDPATRNTVQITTFISSGSAGPDRFTVLGNKLYLSHANNIIVYDGASAPVKLFSYSYNNSNNPLLYGPYYTNDKLALYKNKLYLAVSNPSTSMPQLTAYDFSSKTLKAVPGRAYFASRFAIANNTLYFCAFDSTHGVELWSYNGTSPAAMIADIWPGRVSGFGYNMTSFKNKIYCTGVVPDTTGGLGDTELLELIPATTGTIINNVFSAIKEVTVYPNPIASEATLQMNLQQGATLQVKMVDMTGRAVYTIAVATYAAGETKLNLPMANLAIGTYAYIISDENGKLMHSGHIQKQ